MSHIGQRKIGRSRHPTVRPQPSDATVRDNESVASRELSVTDDRPPWDIVTFGSSCRCRSGRGGFMRHRERHRTSRIGWLRAAVLGANDGIVSTASLVVGVAAAGKAQKDILLAGVAGLVAGALSMAA